MTTASWTTGLRQKLLDDGIDFFILPRADAHHVEWLRPSTNRVERLSGFEGSYAKILVDNSSVALMTSSIYVEAARLKLADGISVIDESICDLDAWLAPRLAHGKVVAIDPWLHTHAEFLHLRKLVERRGATLRLCWTNPVDQLLLVAEATIAPAFAQPLKYSGLLHSEKLGLVVERMRADGVDSYLLSAPDSICWLLNIRGADVFAAPLVYCFALVRADRTVELFVDLAKVTPALVEHLGPAVTVHSYASVINAFADTEVVNIGMDFVVTSHTLVARAEADGLAVVDVADPCQSLKSLKNPVELAGARACHRRDGVAQVQFWCWLTDRLAAGEPPTELEAQDRIDAFRANDPLFRGVSFQTISAARSHGSMGHYHSHATTNVTIDGDGFYLLDSGGQYLDGTTDVTRTIAIGSPAKPLRHRFTQAMRGLIAASSAKFPLGTRGYAIDAFARRPLWEAGGDFPHATGHGVGSYLGVHEGPIRLRTKPDPTALAPGMIVSIEPGFYAVGQFGLRHENLVAVVKVPEQNEPSQLQFETLTLCPFDTSALMLDEMTPAEILWLDDYHVRVWRELSPLVKGNVRSWLHDHTRPIVRA